MFIHNRSLFGAIQAAIDQLNLEGYANLDYWVAELDKKIEGKAGADHQGMVCGI